MKSFRIALISVLFCSLTNISFCQKLYDEVALFKGLSQSYKLKDGTSLIINGNGECYLAKDTILSKAPFESHFKRETQIALSNKTMLFEIDGIRRIYNYYPIDFLSEEILNNIESYSFSNLWYNHQKAIRHEDSNYTLIDFNKRVYKTFKNITSRVISDENYILLKNEETDEYFWYSNDFKLISKFEEKEYCRYKFINNLLVSFNESSKMITIYDKKGVKTKEKVKSICNCTMSGVWMTATDEWFYFYKGKKIKIPVDENDCYTLNDSLIVFRSYNKSHTIFDYKKNKIINQNSYDFIDSEGKSYILFSRDKYKVINYDKDVEVIYANNNKELILYNIKSNSYSSKFAGDEADLLKDSIIAIINKSKLQFTDTKGKMLYDTTINDINFLSLDSLNSNFFYKIHFKDNNRIAFLDSNFRMFYDGKNIIHDSYKYLKLIQNSNRSICPIKTNDLWINWEQTNINKSFLISSIGDTIINNVTEIREVVKNKIYLVFDKRTNESKVINTYKYIEKFPLIPDDYLYIEKDNSVFWYPTFNEIYNILPYTNIMNNEAKNKEKEVIKSIVAFTPELTLSYCTKKFNDTKEKVNKCNQICFDNFCYIANGIYNEKDLNKYEIKNIDISLFVNSNKYVFDYATKIELNENEKLSISKSINALNKYWVVKTEYKTPTRFDTTIPVVKLK